MISKIWVMMHLTKMMKSLTFTENDGRKMIEDVFKASTYFYFEYLKNPKSNLPEFIEVSFF